MRALEDHRTPRTPRPARSPLRGPHAQPRLLALALVVTLVAAPAARAQTLDVAVSGSLPGPGAGVVVGVRGARVEDTDVDLAVRLDAAAQLDLGLRTHATFGPVGNLIGELHASLRSDGPAEASLGARGVLGPVALAVHLLAFGDDPARFDPLAIADDARPAFGAGGWGVRLGGSGRPARTVVLEGDAALYRIDTGWSGTFAARLRLLRAVGPNELSVALFGYAAPGFAPAQASLEGAMTIVRRRAPSITAALSIGVSADGVAPGARLALGQALGGGAEGRLELGLEPYRRDVPPYRLAADVGVPVSVGTLNVRGAAAAGRGATRAAMQVGLAVPVELR